METKLTSNLFDLVALYGKAVRLEEATVGRFCAADGRFFTRLREGKTFSVRKYDAVVLWFASNWPEGLDWPEGVERPELVEAVESNAADAVTQGAAA